ncbi:phage major capsid protein [Synechococcus sp. N32]|uniref:phage major capsid family protein n=1 Tax=Synechococcus sp. N32 TaxID=2575514 RepID=UPI000E0ED8C3|nr:phage major capsid protein [Synechococcus sp. N32]
MTDDLTTTLFYLAAMSGLLKIGNNVQATIDWIVAAAMWVICTKGSGTDLSTVIYGNFNDLMIAQWGALEVLVDPYSDFATGTVGVRALQSIDIGVRHAESFAAMTDAVA